MLERRLTGVLRILRGLLLHLQGSHHLLVLHFDFQSLMYLLTLEFFRRKLDPQDFHRCIQRYEIADQLFQSGQDAWS